MVFTQSPHQSKGDIPGAALGCLRKQRRYFKTREKKNFKKRRTNKHLSIGNDRLERYYQAGQQDVWLD